MALSAVREVVVVHDAACGACAGVAQALPGVLRVPVRVRSCRDPELHAVYPDLPAAARACRTPAVGFIRPNGTVRWRLGAGAAPALLAVLRLRSLPRAARVLVTVQMTALRSRNVVR